VCFQPKEEEEEEEKKGASLFHQKKNRLLKKTSVRNHARLFEPTKDKEIISLSGSKQQNRLVALC
jgi:hypothetical protein|tara:strand:+ start:3201 stop:3395 length:195 start_codon:yes stop_codon:yes gene_type:complete